MKTLKAYCKSVISPKRAIELEDKAALYDGLKRELFRIDLWSSGVSDISKYTADYLNNWIKYYEEESDDEPKDMLNFRTFMPKETKWIVKK